MNAHTHITSGAVPATASKRDYHGDLMDALSIMQCAYVIIDAGKVQPYDTCMDLLVLINTAQEKIRPVADMLVEEAN